MGRATVEEQLTGSIPLEVYRFNFSNESKNIQEINESILTKQRWRHVTHEFSRLECRESFDMGLAPGGSIKQDIYEDEYGLEDWDLRNTDRCFVTLANATLSGWT